MKRSDPPANAKEARWRAFTKRAWGIIEVGGGRCYCIIIPHPTRPGRWEWDDSFSMRSSAESILGRHHGPESRIVTLNKLKRMWILGEVMD